MKITKIKYIKFLFSICLVIYLWNFIDISQLINLHLSVYYFFLISSLITFLSLFLMSIRFNLMLREFSSLWIDTLSVFKFYMIGTFFNIFMPGAIGGDLIRIQQINKMHDISLKKLSIITISERLAGIFGLFFLLSLSLLLKNYPKAINFEYDIPIIIPYSMPAILLLFIPLVKKILQIKGIFFNYIFVLKTLIVLLLAQIGDVLIAYIFSNFLGLNVSFLEYLFIMPIVYIATVIPISFGGLGVREGVFAGILSFYQVEISDSVLLSLLMYLTKIIVGIMGYFVYVFNKN
jgi:glycosyltransferase 2 family protein